MRLGGPTSYTIAVRRLFRWLPKSRWKRYVVLTVIGGFALLLMLVVGGYFLWRIPKVQSLLITAMFNLQLRQPLETPPAPSLPREAAAGLLTNATALLSAGELFRPTNVWAVQLSFTSNQWAALGPKNVPPVPGFIRPDGSVILRNTNASRAGVAGVLGLDLPWSQSSVEFGNVMFTNVGMRFKGNGTLLGALRTHKRSFKIDLNKHLKSQQFVGRKTFNFGNLSADLSFLSDALAYEFYRDAGVPASRTAFARLLLTIDGRFDGRLLGLYVMVENPDAEWAREQFGVDGITLFKPVTYELFKDLGDDWTAYEGIYDPKTKTKPKHHRRVIELAKFVTAASDSDFAGRAGEFIDLDEFARFLACEVVLSNYDSILDNGQNFLLYLDPRTDKFGFIPWDLDHSWGEFPLIGTADLRERVSLWHPWVGENRFIERMLAVEPFRERYRREIERLLAALFVPERLNRRLDQLAAVVRPFIAEESTNRLAKFEITVADKWSDGSRDGNPFDPNRPVFQLKRFFVARAESVKRQLEDKTAGVELARKPPK